MENNMSDMMDVNKNGNSKCAHSNTNMDLFPGDGESNASVDDYSWIFDTFDEPILEDDISLLNGNISTTFKSKAEKSTEVSTVNNMLQPNALNMKSLKITGNPRNVLKPDLSKRLRCLYCNYTTKWPSYLKRHKLKHKKKPKLLKCSVVIKNIDSCRLSNRKKVLDRNELLASNVNVLENVERADRLDNISVTSTYLNKIEQSASTGLGILKNKEIEKKDNYSPSPTNKECTIYSGEIKLPTNINPTLDKEMNQFMHLHTISESKKYKCEFCQFKSNYPQNIPRHALKKHRDIMLLSFPCLNKTDLLLNKEIDQDNYINLNNVSQSKKCDFCDFESNSSQKLGKHAFMKHRDKMFSNSLMLVSVAGQPASCAFLPDHKIFKTSKSKQQNSHSDKLKSSSYHYKSNCPNPLMRKVRHTNGSEANQLKKIVPILANKRNSKIKLKSLSCRDKSKNPIVKCQNDPNLNISSKIYTYDYCNYNSKSSNNIARHSLKKHSGNKLSNNQTVIQQGKRKISSHRLSKCTFCKFKTQNHQDLFKHFMTKHCRMPQPTFKFITLYKSEPNVSIVKENFCENIIPKERKGNVNLGCKVENTVSSPNKENIYDIKDTVRKLYASNQATGNEFIENHHIKVFRNKFYSQEKNRFNCSLCSFNTRLGHSIIRHIKLKHNILTKNSLKLSTDMKSKNTNQNHCQENVSLCKNTDPLNQNTLNYDKKMKNHLERNISSLTKRSEKRKFKKKSVRTIEMFSRTLDINKMKGLSENTKTSAGRDKLFPGLNATYIPSNFKNQSKSCIKNYQCSYCNYESKSLITVKRHVLDEHKDLNEVDKHVQSSVLSSQQAEKVITGELVYLTNSNLIDQEKFLERNKSTVALEVRKGVELASYQPEKPFKWTNLSLDKNASSQKVCIKDKNDPKATTIKPSFNDDLQMNLKEMPNHPISSNRDRSNNPRKVNSEKLSNSQCDMGTITRKCNDILESILASLVPGRNVSNKSNHSDFVLTARYSEKTRIEPLGKNAIDCPGNEDNSSNSHCKMTWPNMQEEHEVTHSLSDSDNKISRNRSTAGIDESLSPKCSSDYHLTFDKPSIPEIKANKEVDIDLLNENKDILPKQQMCNVNNICIPNNPLSHDEPTQPFIEVISPTSKLQRHDIQNHSLCNQFSYKNGRIHKCQFASNLSPPQGANKTNIETMLGDSQQVTNIKCPFKTRKKTVEKKSLRSKGKLNTYQSLSYELSKSDKSLKVERFAQSKTRINRKSRSSKNKSASQIKLHEKEVSSPVESLSLVLQNTEKKDLRISSLNSCTDVSIPAKNIHFDSSIEPRLTRSSKLSETRTTLQSPLSQVPENSLHPNPSKLQSNIHIFSSAGMEVVNSQLDSLPCSREIPTIPLEPIVIYTDKGKILKCSQCSFKTRLGKYQIDRHLASHIKLPLNFNNNDYQIEMVKSLKKNVKKKHRTKEFANKHYKCIHCEYKSLDPRIIKLHELRYEILGYCNRELLNNKNNTILTLSKLGNSNSLNTQEIIEKSEDFSEFDKSDESSFKPATKKCKKVPTQSYKFENSHRVKNKILPPKITMEQIQPNLKLTKQDHKSPNLEIFRKVGVNSCKVLENGDCSKSMVASETVKNKLTQTSNTSSNPDFQNETFSNQLKHSLRVRTFKCFHCEYRTIKSSNFKRHLRSIHKYKGSFLKSLFTMIPIGTKNVSKVKGKTSIRTGNHIKRQPKNLKEKIVYTKRKPDINTLHCPQYKCKHKYNLNNHIKSVHVAKKQSSSNKLYFNCSRCDFKSVWKKNVKRHMQRIHHLKPSSKTS